MINAILLLSATLAATPAPKPQIETFPLPKGELATEITRHGDVMAFVSWRNWPQIEPSLGRITTSGRIQLQQLEKDHMPGLMSVAPDGTLWMSDGRKPVLWRVTKQGEVSQVPVARTSLGIAADKNGSIWATHPESAEITRYGTQGEVQQATFVGRRYGRSAAPSAAIPRPAPPGSGPAAIPQKKDSSRSLTKEERAKLTLDARPSWIAQGPDGALWFCDPTWKSIGRITASGEVTLTRLPDGWGEPQHIAAGRDDALWFTVQNLPIAANISTAGEVRMIDLSGPASALAVDREGRVWVVVGGDFYWIDGEGEVHAVDLPKEPRFIRSMAEGPDGAMWFADQTAHTIGRVTLPASPSGAR